MSCGLSLLVLCVTVHRLASVTLSSHLGLEPLLSEGAIRYRSILSNLSCCVPSVIVLDFFAIAIPAGEENGIVGHRAKLTEPRILRELLSNGSDLGLAVLAASSVLLVDDGFLSLDDSEKYSKNWCCLSSGLDKTSGDTGRELPLLCSWSQHNFSCS